MWAKRDGLGRGMVCVQQDLQMFVRVYRYPAESPWNKTDMIGIPVSIWQRLYAEKGLCDGGTADRPVFVWLGLGNVVGRVQPDADLDWEPGRVAPSSTRLQG